MVGKMKATNVEIPELVTPLELLGGCEKPPAESG
jgi:hypothetical protein